MTNQMLVDEQSSSVPNGVYITNSLFTRFKNEADLQPSENAPYPLAIPTHVHEFVHYLHNISTTAGIRAIFFSHAAVFMAAQFLIGTNHDVHTSSEDSDQSSDINYIINNLNFIYGEFKEDVLQFIDVQDGWKFSNLQTYKPKNIQNGLAYQIMVAGKIGKFVTAGILRIGLNFITEGVAYEVEREIWREKGVLPNQVDARTPPFPYLAYEPLVNYLSGRSTTPRERIEIGNAALMNNSPSKGLVDACLALRKNTSTFESYYRREIDSFTDFVDNDFQSLVNHIKFFYQNTDKLLRPFIHYVSIVESAARKRIACANLELLFLGCNISVDQFLSRAAYIAEHCIIQEKLDKSTVIDVIGHSNSLAVSEGDEISWFYVLCSAIHFVQQHLTKDGRIIETSKIKEKKCPFEGGCDVERLEGYPESCRKFP